MNQPVYFASRCKSSTSLLGGLRVLLTTLLLSLLAPLLVPWANAQSSPDAAALQQQWDHVMFAVDKKQHEASFAALAQQADALVDAQPRNAEILIWAGIIHSTYAGAKGGLGALSEVKKARGLFEKSINIDATALNGAAYTSLGSLYYQVPGWPVSFGDDDKASALLKKGLAADANGVDANYFYGDFLLHQKQYAEAITYLEQAAKAPPRPGRDVADAGRHRQIDEGLAKARGKLAK